MRKPLLIPVLLGIIVSFGLAGCGKGGSAYNPKDNNIAFLKNEHWNKGKAEYQRYKHSLGWYGAKRTSDDSMMVLVKEPWDTKRHVKVPWKQANAYVLKLSIFDIFQTGTYSYSFKSDMYIDTKSGRVLKYVMGSHDGCGNHFMKYEVKGSNGVFNWHSYWNGHGLISIKVPTSKFDTFFDALPAYLRFRLKDKSYSARAVQSLIANRPLDISSPGKHFTNQMDAVKRGLPKIVNIAVTNTPGQQIADAKGVQHKVIKSEVKFGGKSKVFYFAESFPHTLIHSKGKAEKTMYYSEFFPYWVPGNRGKPAGTIK